MPCDGRLPAVSSPGVLSAVNRFRRVLTVLALLALSCLVQTAVIRRSSATGLDAVGFVRFAQQIDREGLLPTVRAQRQQPLFPVWVWAVHGVWVGFAGQSPWAWSASVQLAAAVPLVLAVVPVYFVMVRLAGGAAALASAVFFCLLPEVARLGADGISDSTHLLFFCLAFWAMVEYFRSQESAVRGQGSGGRPGWLLVAGVAVALGVLARAEVLVLALALGVALAASQLRAERRQTWRGLGAAAGCFALGLAMVLVPYLAAVGSMGPRSAVGRILGRHQEDREHSEGTAAASAAAWRLDDGRPASFAAKEPGVSLRRRGYPAAIVRFGRKLADALGYWIGALALWGAWQLHRRRVSAADRFAQIFFVLLSIVAIRFSAVEGYLVPRHLLTLVAAGIGAAGYGALELGRRLAARLGARGPAPGRPVAAAVSWSVVVAAAVACLPQTMVRHHHSRVGHRVAGEWLAARHPADGKVLDTQGLTALYCGRATYAYEAAPQALSDPGLAYLVLEAGELQHESDRARTLRWLVQSAELAAEFPRPQMRKPNQRPVLVYRWRADRFHRHLAMRAAGTRTPER